MRGGILDHQAREHTITLYLDKTEFRQALDLPHEDTVMSSVAASESRGVLATRGTTMPTLGLMNQVRFQSWLRRPLLPYRR
jgi:hypothetical protein